MFNDDSADVFPELKSARISDVTKGLASAGLLLPEAILKAPPAVSNKA